MISVLHLTSVNNKQSLLMYVTLLTALLKGLWFWCSCTAVWYK